MRKSIADPASLPPDTGDAAEMLHSKAKLYMAKRTGCKRIIPSVEVEVQKHLR